jgi:hypothetical protein
MQITQEQLSARGALAKKRSPGKQSSLFLRAFSEHAEGYITVPASSAMM